MSEDTIVKQLDVNVIQPNPHQPRKQLDPASLQDLVISIKKFGIIEPIILANTPAGYQIIAGERRWRAAREAGLTHVPVIIKKVTPRSMLEMSLVENIQREDLNPLERAYAIDRLIKDFGMTQSQVAAQIGKSLSYVSNSTRLLELPDALKDGLLSNLISEGHARALMGILNPDRIIEAYKIILKSNGSVRQAEELARRFNNQTKWPKGFNPPREKPIRNLDIDLWEKRLSEVLGDISNVKVRRSDRQTLVRIRLQGSVEETQAALNKILSITEDGQQ